MLIILDAILMLFIIVMCGILLGIVVLNVFYEIKDNLNKRN